MSLEEGPTESSIKIEKLASDPFPRPLSHLELAQRELVRMTRENPSNIREDLVKKGIGKILDGTAMVAYGSLLIAEGLARRVSAVSMQVAEGSKSVAEKVTELRPYLQSMKRKG